jgi:hypothetical protein
VLVINLFGEWLWAEASVGESWLEQGTYISGAELNEVEGGDHRVLGARSLGRLSTKATMPLRTTTRATTTVIDAV